MNRTESSHSFNMPKFFPKQLVSRSELMERVRNLVVIVKDYEQRDLLTHIKVPTLPYYLVGLDDEIEKEVRNFLTEMIFIATFEHTREDDAGIAGILISRLARISTELQAWINHAPRFTEAERDWLYDWCNPMYFARFGNDDQMSMAPFGCGAYIDGRWNIGVVNPKWIKEIIGFDDEKHAIVYNQS